VAACGGSHAAGSRGFGAAGSGGSGSAGSGGSGSKAGSLAGAARSVPDGDWLQFNFDAQRSGAGPARTGITAANVRGLSLRLVHLDGIADSAAIQLHGVRVRGRKRDVVIVTTTYGRTIAVDPGTGAKLWEYVPGDIGSYQGSSQVTTASPTADPTRRFLYTTSPDGRVHKLAVSNGHQVWSRRVTLDPRREKLASPPTVSGGSLIVVTDGYFGDAPSYQGHVVLLSRATGRIQRVWNSLCSNRHGLLVPRTCGASGSAIWGRAGAVLVPGSRDILVTTANGPFNGSTDWGDSVLELSPGASRLLHNFTPTGQASLNANDTDLGSTSPALLPDPGGPPLAVQGGKDGRLKLLNLSRLDGTTGPAGPRTGGQLQELPTPGGAPLFSAAAVDVLGGRTWLFVADGSGTAGYVLHPGASPRLSVGWQDSTAGTSPVAAGGLLYVYDFQGGRLDVRVPTSGRLLASLPAASGHWSSPIAIGGRVVLPVGGSTSDNATSGALFIWHLAGR
jgi:outer membrane protein assembly factor BamB